jgi:ATP synthase F1 delta subunit
MRYTLLPLSKKYAQAYLQEYQDSLTLEQVQSFKPVIQFCRDHNNFLSVISVLVGKQPGFEELLEEMRIYFSLPMSIQKLMKLLIKRKKINIFAQILQDIYCLYMLHNNTHELTITTAETLEEDQKKRFEDFFKKLSGKKIISTAMIDESLIAGIRMQTDHFLWEYSIKSRMAQISRKMLDEE